MATIFSKIPILGPHISELNKNIRVLRWKKRLNKVRDSKNLKIVIGASGHYQENWIPTDIEYLNLLDYKTWDNFFNPNSLDAILAEHVWEHLTLDEGIVAANNCFKFLKKGGYLRIAVPDGYHPDKTYIDCVKPGGHGDGADDHKLLYNVDIMCTYLEEIGFQVKPLEYFDQSGNFIYNEWNPNSGMIMRSKRFDHRNKEGKLKYTSLIIDAIK